jgi:hypothetical protein
MRFGTIVVSRKKYDGLELGWGKIGKYFRNKTSLLGIKLWKSSMDVCSSSVQCSRWFPRVVKAASSDSKERTYFFLSGPDLQFSYILIYVSFHFFPCTKPFIHHQNGKEGKQRTKGFC